MIYYTVDTKLWLSGKCSCTQYIYGAQLCCFAMQVSRVETEVTVHTMRCRVMDKSPENKQRDIRQNPQQRSAKQRDHVRRSAC